MMATRTYKAVFAGGHFNGTDYVGAEWNGFYRVEDAHETLRWAWASIYPEQEIPDVLPGSFYVRQVEE